MKIAWSFSWSGLLGILRQTNGALYWPGCRVIAVGHAEAIAHMPPDMIEKLGPPVVIAAPAEILDWIKRS